MTDKEALQDPLKPLDKICDPDERQANFVAGLEDNHSEISSIVLNESVPLDVRQLFETAKNLSLYSWFVYRFHQVAELIGFTAMEMVLRERYKQENPNTKKKVMLGELLRHAKDNRWVTNEGFSNLKKMATNRAQQNKIYDLIKNHDFEKNPSPVIEEPSEEDIAEVLKELDVVDSILKAAKEIRNSLAHGSNTLHPNSISTLRQTAEIINQIYLN